MALAGINVEVDWNRSGLFNHASSNINAYVMAGNYRIGMTKAYQEVANTGRLTVLLDNSDGAWNIENPSSPFNGLFRKGLMVRFQWIESLPVTRFIGTISNLQVSVGTLGAHTATLTVEDPLLTLMDSEYVPPLLTNVRTDEVIERMFDDAVLSYPYPKDYWMLGIDGSTELDTTTTLFESTVTTSFLSQGDTTFEYVGDNADNGFGVSALGYIRDVVAAEAGGRFFWKASTSKSQFVFHNRRWAAGQSAITFTTDMILQDPPALYLYGDDLMNECEVGYEVKKLGTAGSIIYTATNTPFSIQSNSNRKFNARYRDATVQNARVGAINPINPAPGVDYIANTASDGSGTDVTALVGVSCEFGANSANVTIFNQSGATAYITTFQLRGQPITTFARQTALARDGVSIAANGYYKRTRDIPFISDAEFAANYAQALVSRFKNPFGRFERISLRLNDSYGISIVARTLGDIISYSDVTLNNLSTEYIVIGEEAQWTNTGIANETTHAIVTFVLEPVNRATYWILGETGKTELDYSTILAL